MRIRVLGRFIATFALLTLFSLCLIPASTQDAVARPINWPSDEPPPKGDNDGVVLKTGGIKSDTGSAADRSGAGTFMIASGRHIDRSALRGYYAMMMLRYWSFWLR